MNTDQPEGNYYNKYESKNFIVKKLMKNFYCKLRDVMEQIDFKCVYEAGCGEGYISDFIYNYDPKLQVYASDISVSIVNKAKIKYPQINFSVSSVYDLELPDENFDLVVACEVLEHLEEPQKALKELFRISSNYVLISVPNEPLWRFCNVLRGKYLKDFGNTPGHIQHWNLNKICNLVSQHGEIIDFKSPTPWNMVLIKKK